MKERYAITTATVVLLVLLRLNIGWHFFSEGMQHALDPHWTSEAVLRAAKGPLAPLYQMYLPDFHQLEDLLHRDTSQSDSPRDWRLDRADRDRLGRRATALRGALWTG